MVRVIRTPKRRRPTDFTEHHIKHLLVGHDFVGLGFNDVAAMREAWEVLRDELLPIWTEEHPGSRPWSWWAFDATERRRRIDGKPHPFDNSDRITEVERIADLPDTSPDFRDQMKRLVCGKPNALLVADDFVAEYESEQDYLARLGL